MANVNTISFGPSQQDLQAQQIDLARRQQIADALRAQSLTPIESQMVSGRVVPTSPWLGAIKLAQAGLANQAQSQNAADEAALGQASAQRQAAALRALAPSGTFDQPQEPIQLGNGLTEEPPIPKVDQATKNRWAKILAANSYDPGLAKKLLENELTTPEETRNLIAQGIDPTAFGKARLGKEVAGGVTNVAAGTSVFNPQTGQFVAAAPDFANGVQGGFSPNGQPQVSRIAGSDILPQIAGEKARAEAQGRAGYNTITVNTPNGPVLMTEEQAASLSGGRPSAPNESMYNGSPPNLGFPAGTQIPAPTPGGQSRLDILSQERQGILGRPDSDPRKAADLAAIDREISSLLPKQSQSQIGIPLQSEEAKAFGSSVAKGAGEDLLKSRDSAKAAAADLFNINESRNAIKSGAFLGGGANVKANLAKTINGWLGTDIDANKVTNTEYLRSTLGQRMLDNAKKLGVNPTDADARRLDEIVGTIAKDPKALSLALDFQESMARRAIQQHNANVSQASKNGLKSPYDLTVQAPTFGQPQANPGQPILDDLLNKYGGH